MPSKSVKQHRFFQAVANNPAFAEKAGIPQRVGADFLKADKGRKFAKGGDMAKKFPPFMGKETKAEGIHGKSGKAKPTKYAKGGGCEMKGKPKAFAGGGMPMMAPPPTAPAPASRPVPAPATYSGPVPTGTAKEPPKAQPVGGTLQPGVAGGQGAGPAPTNYSKPSVGVAPAPTMYPSKPEVGIARPVPVPVPAVGLGSANPNSGIKAPFAPVPLSSINSGTPGSRGSSGGSFGRARAKLSKFNPSVPTQRPGFNDRQVSPPESGPARKAFFDQLESSKPKMGQGDVGIAQAGTRMPTSAERAAEEARLSSMSYEQRKQIADKAGRSFGGIGLMPPAGYKDPRAIQATDEQIRSQLPPGFGSQFPSLAMKKGGAVKKFAKGGSVGVSASSCQTKGRSMDGCAQRGKTKCKVF